MRRDAQEILSPDEEKRQAAKREEEKRKQEEARQVAMRDDARSSCMTQYNKTAMCGCMVAALDDGGLSDGEWQTLKGDFKKVSSISKDHGDLGDQIMSCLRQK